MFDTCGMVLCLVYVLGSCFLLLHVVNFLFSKTHLYRCSSKLPNPHIPIWLIISMITKMSTVSPLANLMHIVCDYCHLFDRDRIFCIWLFYRPAVFFYKQETVEVLMNNNNTIDKSLEYRLTEALFGKGLVTSTGDKWRSRRKMLTPAFHFRILQDFMPVLNEQSKVLVRQMLKGAEQPHVDISPLVSMCSLDIICETAMGVRIGCQSGGYSDFRKALYELEEGFMYRCLRPWLWLDFVFFHCSPYGWQQYRNVCLVKNVTNNVIKQKKDLMLEHKRKGVTSENTDLDPSPLKRRKAFLEMLLECHFQDESFTEEDIREEVNTFMLAGHETLAAALSFTLHNVGLNPEVQEKLIKEMDSIFGGDTERDVTSDDLCQMKYTECVIKETLRLHPPVPMIARELKEDVKVLDYTIAPGTLCVIFPVMLHRDPKVFPDPEKFLPERFFPENSTGRHPYAYIPFSAGPRNCIGQKFALMEGKTILANVFRNMRVMSLNTSSKFHMKAGVTLTSVDPLLLKITPRLLDEIN